MRRLCVVLVAGLSCVCAATSAYGKSNVRATLDNPAKLLRAAPGDRIRIGWTLTESASPLSTAPDRVAPRPFGAGGVYVRVRGVDAKSNNVATTPVSHASQPGHYVADVKVPAGGIAAIAIGLEGFRIVPGHAPARADVFFPIVNDPFTAANTPVTATSAARGATTPWALLAAAMLCSPCCWSDIACWPRDIGQSRWLIPLVPLSGGDPAPGNPPRLRVG